MSLSDCFVDFAVNQAAGQSYGKGKQAFAVFVFPYDTLADAVSMASAQECCATTARRCLDGAGIDGTVTYNGRPLDVLRCPYAPHDGAIFALLQTLAQANHAWKSSPTADDMQPGTVVFLAGPQHVAMLTGPVTIDSNGVVRIGTTEGGQEDPNNPPHCTAILAKERTVNVIGGKLHLDNRPVVGCFAVDDLPARSDA